MLGRSSDRGSSDFVIRQFPFLPRIIVPDAPPVGGQGWGTGRPRAGRPVEAGTP
jgi:hypothetical protein